jgi:hypothetical protein
MTQRSSWTRFAGAGPPPYPDGSDAPPVTREAIVLRSYQRSYSRCSPAHLFRSGGARLMASPRKAIWQVPASASSAPLNAERERDHVGGSLCTRSGQRVSTTARI